jgi:hypothetical protein
MMTECCEHPKLHHQAIFEKYAEKRFKEASTIVQQALDAGFTLPHHGVPVRSLHPPPQSMGFQDHLDHLAALDANGLLVTTEV